MSERRFSMRTASSGLTVTMAEVKPSRIQRVIEAFEAKVQVPYLERHDTWPAFAEAVVALGYALRQRPDVPGPALAGSGGARTESSGRRSASGRGGSTARAEAPIQPTTSRRRADHGSA